MRWWSLIAWLVLCFAVAAIGGRWTAPEIGGWYASLRRPTFSPPNWIFGPVWTLLYALMAVAAWQIWQAESSPARTLALAIFLIQLALNLGWSWIFLKQHAIGAAAAEVATLWMAIG